MKNERHQDYWINQSVDVDLVIRQKDERQIVFEGERLDMQAVWKLRDRFFSPRREAAR